ncbi:hypothetical protein EJB05_18248 [Eragrostis curvula]|uniref:Uncharacterized protein n=1 Tax=Eragrostis curvula TaxID=38414 RepID=A0A5J9VL56_9POAL|nr:hypothetical protein EJB05_18248 [Eragrostis curvula]
MSGRHPRCSFSLAAPPRLIGSSEAAGPIGAGSRREFGAGGWRQLQLLRLSRGRWVRSRGSMATRPNLISAQGLKACCLHRDRYWKSLRPHALGALLGVFEAATSVLSSNCCHAPKLACATNRDLILAPPSRTNLHSSSITTPTTTAFSFAWASTLPADEVFRDFLKITYP